MQTSYALLLAALLAAGAMLVRRIDRVRGDEPLQEVLYIPSPKVLKRMSLGYTEFWPISLDARGAVFWRRKQGEVEAVPDP